MSEGIPRGDGLIPSLMQMFSFAASDVTRYRHALMRRVMSLFVHSLVRTRLHPDTLQPNRTTVVTTVFGPRQIAS